MCGWRGVEGLSVGGVGGGGRTRQVIILINVNGDDEDNALMVRMSGEGHAGR